MDKKRAIGIKILAWIIIIGSAISFLPLLFPSYGLIPYKVGQISAIFTLAPHAVFTIGAFLGQHPAVGGLLMYALYLFSVVLGAGILRLKSPARIAVILISWIQIAEAAYSAWDFEYLKAFFIAIGSLSIHMVYIYYLTRPKVKEQFK